MKRYFAGVFAIAAILLVPIHRADAFNALMKDGLELRWYQKVVPFYINPSGMTDIHTQALIEATLQCAKTWESVNFGLRFEYRGLTDLKLVDENDDVNVIFFEQNTKTWDATFPNQKSALAMTRVGSQEGEIQGFDMVFNDGRYTFTDTLDPQLMVYDYLNTCTHEMGHALGLDHSEIDDATMAATSTIGDVEKRDLDIDDQDGIRHLYRSGFPEEIEQFGCSTGPLKPSRLPVWTLSLALPLLWTRRQRAQRKN